MERVEAEAIYEQGRAAVVEVLLALSAQNERLSAQVEALTARVARQESGSRSLSARPGARRATPRSRRVRIRPAARRGAGRIGRVASRVASRVMRARDVRCCRYGDNELYDHADRLIDQLHDLDPRADEFRYPFRTSGEAALGSVDSLSFDRIGSALRPLSDFFDIASTVVQVDQDAKDEVLLVRALRELG